MNTQKVRISIPESANNSRVRFQIYSKIEENNADALQCEGIGILRVERTAEPGLFSVYISNPYGPDGGGAGKMGVTFIILNQTRANLLREASPGLPYEYEVLETDREAKR